VLIFVCFQLGRGAGDLDYWSEDFDTEKNCQQEKKIIELKNKVKNSNSFSYCCSSVTKKDACYGTAVKKGLFKKSMF